MQPNGLSHLAVRVRDLDRAEAFYSGVLALTVTRRWADDDGAPRSFWLPLGDGAFLAVERADLDAPVPAPDGTGWHCITLRIGAADREAWRERLTAAGHPIERETPFTLYTRDPEGALVALSHYPSN